MQQRCLHPNNCYCVSPPGAFKQQYGRECRFERRVQECTPDVRLSDTKEIRCEAARLNCLTHLVNVETLGWHGPTEWQRISGSERCYLGRCRGGDFLMITGFL